jgi:hypothetical protein
MGHVLGSVVIQSEVPWHASDMVVCVNWHQYAGWCEAAEDAPDQISAVSAQVLVVVQGQTQKHY